VSNSPHISDSLRYHVWLTQLCKYHNIELKHPHLGWPFGVLLVEEDKIMPKEEVQTLAEAYVLENL